MHNRFGLKRGGIQIQVTNTIGGKVTSQPGEWPHTCLVLKNDNFQTFLLGGATLIAPKTVVTAAHIVR